MKISIIIPTYNEKDNIKKLIKKIFNSLKKYNFEIIFVDDNSTDGTTEIIEKISKKNRNIKLIKRKRRMGINSAFICGYKKSVGKYVVLMDADLQHPPEKIPEMIEYLKNGYDLVISSRFLKNSKIIEYPLFRKLFSIIMCKIIKLLIRKIKVNDPLSGFFAIRREKLEEIIDKIKFKRGFKILIEILINSKKIKIKEIPFVFRPRIYGKSKVNKTIVLEFFKQIIYYFILNKIIK